ncbi:nuclease-related domain-containing DEAD/DEAH box helicase [Saccharothrix sp. NRRL B-16314]|uniref:nuclease-related domain-containing DEAD/DEAH box helicase n=1 Tax=Saccharothrix sp. NRRL B-16314 TaxID=1463825 RepID=UPI0009DEEE3E|nr:NERD domain-containing protein/DEAD/DEAH box helicase [Saccharothrix sp. NRRL B-16314]
MRMIPDSVSPGSSNAEQAIFSQLEALEVLGWEYAMHSTNLPEHDRKRVCEIDFLLLGERGLLVLEVKGGEILLKRDVWHTRDLKGKRHRLKESPLNQARTSMFALEKVLRRTTDPELVERTVFGYGVVFPDSGFDPVSAQWAPEMVINSIRLESEGWVDCLDRLGAFWEGKPEPRGPLSAEDVERYLNVLRPDFDRVLSLRRLDDLVEKELVALTKSQYKALDQHHRNPRLVFEGGAGTGKTMLAVEMCRRVRGSEKRILLTCRSHVLAAFIRSQQELDGITAVPFEQVSAFDADSFDVVVVDEAQDVINARDLDVLDTVLTGGLVDGRWAFFLDSNNQRGLVGHYEDEAKARLDSHRPTFVDLMDNCRNTIEIVRATQERTGADLGVTTAGHGREVVVVEMDRGEAVTALSTALVELEEHGVPLEQVVLLSPHELLTSIFAELPTDWRDRIDVLDLMRMRRPGRGRVGFARVAEFKGLESRYVVLEVDETADEQSARAQLYVGMTRAKAALWVVKPCGSGVGA